MKSKIIAHRGFSGRYPENTMLAFKAADIAQADGIELDVHLSKDGEVVICHDERIDRTSNGHGYIKDYTLKQIQEYTFLNGMDQWQDQNPRDLTAPSLFQFFSWFVDTEMFVNIEIKNNIFAYPGIVEKVLTLIHKFDLKDRVILSSFNHRTIREIQQSDSTLSCGFLTGCSLLEPGKYCQQYDAQFYHPYFHSINAEDVQNCHDKGVGLNVWTVDRQADMQTLIEWGVEGLITNQVELAKSVLTDITK